MNKKIISILLAILMLTTIVPVSVFAEDDVLNYLTYEIIDGEVTILDCDTSIIGDVVIPNTIEGYPVTTIGVGAFEYCNSMTSIFIPANIKTIAVNFDTQSCCFYSQTLECITVDENNEYYSSDANGVLYNKDKTTLIFYPSGRKEPDFIVPESVTKIEVFSFYSTNYLENLTITQNVREIGNNEYPACHLIFADMLIYDLPTIKSDFNLFGEVRFDTIHLTEKVTLIEEFKDAFYYTTKNITVDSANTVYDSYGGVLCDSGITTFLYNTAEWRATSDFEIPSTVVKLNDNLTFEDIDISKDGALSNVEYIGKGVFGGNLSVNEIVIEEYVKYIGSGAFSPCSTIRSITILNKNCIIEDFAFGYTIFDVENREEFYSLLNEYNSLMLAGEDKKASEIISTAYSKLSYYDSLQVDPDFVVYGYADSTAETYALENRLKFVEILDNSSNESDDCTENICEHTNTSLVNVKSATCTENGYTGDTVCDKCGETLSTGTATNPLNHDMSEWTVTTSATCENVGEERSDCSRCDYYETREIAIKEHEDNDNDGHCDECTENICEH